MTKRQNYPAVPIHPVDPFSPLLTLLALESKCRIVLLYGIVFRHRPTLQCYNIPSMGSVRTNKINNRKQNNVSCTSLSLATRGRWDDSDSNEVSLQTSPGNSLNVESRLLEIKDSIKTSANYLSLSSPYSFCVRLSVCSVSD